MLQAVTATILGWAGKGFQHSPESRSPLEKKVQVTQDLPTSTTSNRTPIPSRVHN